MANDRGLLEIIQRLVTDSDFREQLTIAPRETMMTELGISQEVYNALIALVPVLLAGGVWILGDGPFDGDIFAPPHDWGGRNGLAA